MLSIIFKEWAERHEKQEISVVILSVEGYGRLIILALCAHPLASAALPAAMGSVGDPLAPGECTGSSPPFHPRLPLSGVWFIGLQLNQVTLTAVPSVD